MKHCSSDLSSDDNTPHQSIKLPKNQEHAKKKELFKFRQDKCEFCEELFFCSYDMLVHNAKHIIIPLQNNIEKCSQCDSYFPSTMDLEIHTKIYHFKVPDILECLVMNKPVVRCDNSVTELVIQNNEKKLEKILHKKAVVECDSTITDLIKEKNKEKLKEFFNKQPVIRCEDTIKSLHAENLKNKCENEKLKKDLINSVPKVVLMKQDILQSSVTDLKQQEIVNDDEILPELKKDLINSVPKIVLMKQVIVQSSVKDLKQQENVNEILPECNIKTNGTSNIKSRLIFEEDESDFEDDIISTNVNGVMDNPMTESQDICDLTLDDSDDELMDKEVLPNRTSNSEKILMPIELVEENMTPVVHYEDLIEPSCWKCEKCGLTFSNRYDLIIHETRIHLRLQQRSMLRTSRVCPLCDMYIAGNHWTLKHHINKEHTNISNRPKPSFTLKNCLICNLKYYRYTRHCKNYHLTYNCTLCSNKFEMESQLTDHSLTCKGKYQDPTLPQIFEDRIGMEKIIKVCELCSLFLRNNQILKYVPLRDYSEQGRRTTCDRCEKEFFEVKLIKLINKHPIVQPRYEPPKKTAQAQTNEFRLKKIQKRLKLMNKKF